jgi:di/tripeptidase
MRAVVAELGERLKAAIVIEGMALGRIYHAGIAVRRLKVIVTAPGGHSWLHYGEPSAIHQLLQFGAELSRFDLPQNPRTTLNIGLVEGGRSINTIAPCAACYIDLRSEDADALATLENRVRKLAEKHRRPDVAFDIEVVGDRPAGGITLDHPLVRLAIDAHRAIKMPVELERGSTDANALLSQNIPAVCVGVSYGGNAHVLTEYVETSPFEDGLWQLLLLTAAASNGMLAW